MAKAGMTEPSDNGHLIRARIPGWSEWKQIPCSPEEAVDQAREKSSRDRDQLNGFLLSSLQMQNLLVLAGSGTSINAGGPSMKTIWTSCVGDADPKLVGDVKSSVNYGDNDGENNIEELLSRCEAFLQFDESDEVAEFRAWAVERILALCRSPGLDDQQKLATHREFLRRLARRRARDTRLKLFTTNYDKCFEAAAGGLGLVAIDGFSFSNPRRFDPRFFDYDIVIRKTGVQDSSAFVPGVFQYYKLHGSVDWCVDGEAVKVDPDVSADRAAMIFPASTKFRVSYRQPHLELMAQYLAALRQPNTCLVVIGFGFNDAHISEPILAAMDTSPHLRVVVVSPTVEQDVESSANPEWRRLAALAHGGRDLAFIAATFDEFVPMIPDLRALSPAEQLARAVVDVAK